MPHVDVSVRPDLRGSCYYYFNIFPILIKQDCVCGADFSLFFRGPDVRKGGEEKQAAGSTPQHWGNSGNLLYVYKETKDGNPTGVRLGNS